jgi:immunity protein 51 of polymorphic toxin system
VNTGRESRDSIGESLFLQQMLREGWNGNGYDWTAIARLTLTEKLPELVDEIEFDPEAGTFSANAAAAP